MKSKEQSFTEERQLLTSARQDHEVKRLTEKLKDKDETIGRINLFTREPMDKHAKLELVTEELVSSNKILKAELEKYKRAMTKVAMAPVKSTLKNVEVDKFKEEIAKREREVDEMRKDLHMAQSELVTTKASVSEHQLQIGELETKVSELQTALTKERSQVKTQILKSEEDKKKIQDLNRQVREMERILKRHHPNSISALILTANSESMDSASGQTPRVKFLENRVQQLEQEIAKKESDSQAKLQEIQNKLQEMKVKYEEHTSDLELQLATAKHQSHMWRQTAEKIEAKVSPESKPEQQPVRESKMIKKALPPPMVIAVGAPPPNALAVREDSHLVATIRGLKQELTTKERELVKVRRELEETIKTNRRLQKERERHLGIVPVPSRPPAVRGPPRDEQSSESSQRSSTKVYEVVSPPEYQENVTKLEQENGKLRQELMRLEEEYRSLHSKRLEDLNLLQEEHEAEIDHLISDHMTRNSNPHVSDLQNQLCTQQSLIDHLKEQLRRTEERQEELELLRVERVHLEKNNMELHKKLADLRNIMTPEMVQYEALQEKLAELERRHEVREQKLQAMVKDLLRRNAEQRALSGDDSNAITMREKLLDKNRQLCLYRAEIDRILNTLREFNKHKKSGNAIS
ncbi:hypothetical protein L9F63_006569 [Diploptera punctata]|uniref:Centrosomal protein of 162 kDa n=1 Tax=Diploptera punctata TaxID=6984 RepID=A0AAD7ZAM1_DIPPU|nr:hypothetical protein L9F63_006569 [Diploptera punctata]